MFLVNFGLPLLIYYKCNYAACELLSILPFGVWPHSFFLGVVPLILVLFCNAIPFTFQMYLVSRYLEPVTFLVLRHIDHLDTYCATLKNNLFSPAFDFTRRNTKYGILSKARKQYAGFALCLTQTVTRAPHYVYREDFEVVLASAQISYGHFMISGIY